MILSVLVGTCDRLGQLRELLRSVREGTRAPTRILVSDAGSTDGTVEFLRAEGGEGLVPVFEGRRRGQAAALNDLLRLVETPYVCWLSDDNVVVPGALDTAVAILDGEPRIGMVGLKVRDVKGPFTAAPYIGGVSAIGILNVNQGLLRTAVLREVGGFSEAFRDYGIDPDLTAKVLLSGHDIVYTREVAVRHARNWTEDRASPEFARIMERQKAYLEMYRRKYAAFAEGGPAWRAKKAAWTWLTRATGLERRLDGADRVLGQLPRDWHNIFTGRYISVLDPVRCRRRPYHLRQSISPRQRPHALPSDPAPSVAT